MKVRIYQKTKICCTFTREELQKRNIKSDDILYHTPKGEQLLKEITEKIAQDIGLKTNLKKMKLEIIPLDEINFSIIIPKPHHVELNNSKKQSSEATNAKIINLQQWIQKHRQKGKITVKQPVIKELFKVSNREYRAFLTKQEMKEYNLFFSDFTKRRRRAFDLIVDIIIQSIKQYNYYRIPAGHRYSIVTHIKDDTGILIRLVIKENITFPYDTIVTMNDWEVTFNIPSEVQKLTKK